MSDVGPETLADESPGPVHPRGGDPPAPPAAARPDAAPTPRRAYGFEAGRLFRRLRAEFGDLVFRPGSPAAAAAVDRTASELHAAAAAAAAVAGEGVEHGIDLWLHELRKGFRGYDWAEWLLELQGNLDALTGQARSEYDLAALRADVLAPYHKAFDGQRSATCAGLPGPVADAFRLGETVESGAFPDAALSRPGRPGCDNAMPAPGWWAFGNEATPGRDADDRLVLAPPLRSRFDQPWHPAWPARVRAEWRECGLPEPPDGVLPAVGSCPPAARRAAVDGLHSHAARLLGQPYTPPVVLHDRLRLADEGAQVFELDGRRIPVEGRRAFVVFRAVYDAHPRELTAREIQKLPGCRGVDVSKERAKLPDGLRELMQSSKGAGAAYSILLPAAGSGG